ncbi:MAG: HEXXH motif-containing putative peptide modification protein [Longimicrobiales bacterium]|nr:HEXXH motif-containing putative peptide modification protein [Longimicrobiales bacterium]
MTDWYRVGVPQEDGYDVEVIRGHAQRRWGERILAGAMVVERLPWEMDRYEAVDPDEAAPLLDLVRLWPLGWSALSGCVDAFYPIRTAGSSMSGGGCSCGHSLPGERLAIYATVDNAFGGAEGFCHEAGHARLYALGIDMEAHDGKLLANDPEERYESPIRKDKLRPMSAVLQGQYAYIFVTAFDVALHPQNFPSSPVGAAEVERYVGHNLPRIKEGRATIERHVKTTAEGEKFIRGIQDWTDEVIARAEVLL